VTCRELLLPARGYHCQQHTALAAVLQVSFRMTPTLVHCVVRFHQHINSKRAQPPSCLPKRHVPVDFLELCFCSIFFADRGTTLRFGVILYSQCSKELTIEKLLQVSHIGCPCSLCLAFQVYCNTLQHTATHCNTLQHTATRCHTLQHCNALHHIVTYCVATHYRTQRHTTITC